MIEYKFDMNRKNEIDVFLNKGLNYIRVLSLVSSHLDFL